MITAAHAERIRAVTMPPGETEPRFPHVYYVSSSRYVRALIHHQRLRQETAVRHGLTLRQYELLLILRASETYPRTSIGDLASLLEVESNTITALIDRLVAQGKVQRTHAPRGVVYPVLTPDGQQQLDDAIADMAQSTDYGNLSALIAALLQAMRHFPAGRAPLEELRAALGKVGMRLDY